MLVMGHSFSCSHVEARETHKVLWLQIRNENSFGLAKRHIWMQGGDPLQAIRSIEQVVTIVDYR